MPSTPPSLPLFVEPPSSLLPPFRWVGGKRWLVRLFRERGWIPRPGQRWVEPFAGSCSMALGLAGEGVEVWVNDQNRSLVRFFLSLQEGHFPQPPYLASETDFYAMRDRLNVLLRGGDASEEEGHLFYKMLQNSWKGLWRVNKSGAYNAPFGGASQASQEPEPDFEAIRQRIKAWRFTCGSYTTPLAEKTTADFLYLDPPYIATFDSYTPFGFSLLDHLSLLDATKDHQGPVVISNAPCPPLEAAAKARGFAVEALDKKSRLVENTKPNEVLFYKNL